MRWGQTIPPAALTGGWARGHEGAFLLVCGGTPPDAVDAPPGPDVAVLVVYQYPIMPHLPTADGERYELREPLEMVALGTGHATWFRVVRARRRSGQKVELEYTIRDGTVGLPGPEEELYDLLLDRTTVEAGDLVRVLDDGFAPPVSAVVPGP